MKAAEARRRAEWRGGRGGEGRAVAGDSEEAEDEEREELRGAREGRLHAECGVAGRRGEVLRHCCCCRCS